MGSAVKLADLIEDYTLPQWVDFPDIEGFRVQVQLPDNALKVGALMESQGAGGQSVGAKLLATFAVADWEGLTVAGLKKLVKGKIKGNDFQVIPCSPDNVAMLIKFSIPFYLFLLNQINRREEEAAREDADLKN